VPDRDAVRLRIASRFKTGNAQAFVLVRAVDRDCVGAVLLLDDDEDPKDCRQISDTHLSDSDIEQLPIESPRSTSLGKFDYC
jgi:serine/threonine-protein kinase HipA